MPVYMVLSQYNTPYITQSSLLLLTNSLVRIVHNIAVVNILNEIMESALRKLIEICNDANKYYIRRWERVCVLLDTRRT